MITQLTTDPAVPGANEDAAGALASIAVLADGAGIPHRFRAGCHHSVAWYSHQLTARLLTAALDETVSLTAAAAQAITEVASLHQEECDLAAGSPSATLVAVRVIDEQLEHLVLCDSSLLIEHPDGTVTRLTDDRADRLRLPDPTPEAVEAQRNAPGGFWVARHEPEAAAEALAGTTPLADIAAVHLVSDGITRTVDLLRTHDESELAAALSADPRGLIRQLRTAERALPAERRPRKIHDDATVVTLTMAPEG